MLFRSRKTVEKLGSRKKLTLPAIERADGGVGDLAAVVIVKNEALYIREWLEFHRLLGCAHFYIYDNGSEDGTPEILGPYVRAGIATVNSWPRFDEERGPQVYAYAHALCGFGPRWRWMMFLDADEFLFPVEAETLTEVLRDYEDLPALAVPWRMFGSSGHVNRPPGPVIENYTMRAPFPPGEDAEELLKVKCIVDPTKVSRVVGVHMFDLKTGARTAYNEKKQSVDYQTYRNRDRISDDILRLNHYFTKSGEDFEAKVSKGSAARPSPSDRDGPGDLAGDRRRAFAEMVERSPVEDRSIQRFLPRLKQSLADPPLA